MLRLRPFALLSGALLLAAATATVDFRIRWVGLAPDMRAHARAWAFHRG